MAETLLSFSSTEEFFLEEVCFEWREGYNLVEGRRICQILSKGQEQVKKDELGGVYLKKNKHPVYWAVERTGSGGKRGGGWGYNIGGQTEDLKAMWDSQERLFGGEGDWLLKRDTWVDELVFFFSYQILKWDCRK